jgi:hypothetical protein
MHFFQSDTFLQIRHNNIISLGKTIHLYLILNIRIINA